MHTHLLAIHSEVLLDAFILCSNLPLHYFGKIFLKSKS